MKTGRGNNGHLDVGMDTFSSSFVFWLAIHASAARYFSVILFRRKIQKKDICHISRLVSYL